MNNNSPRTIIEYFFKSENNLDQIIHEKSILIKQNLENEILLSKVDLYHIINNNKNESEAKKLFKLAAESDNPAAMFYVSVNVLNIAQSSKYESECISLLFRAAQMNYGPALTLIGDCYYCGEKLGKNYDKAVKYLTQAAEEGEELSQTKLGLLYLLGSEIPEDPNKAFLLLSKAAAKNNLEAMTHLAFCHLFGVGTHINEDEALRLFYIAEHLGSTVASFTLGRLYYDGVIFPQNYEKAYSRFIKCAEVDHVPSLSYLASMSEHGYFVPIDLKLAFEYYYKAACMGDEKAKKESLRLKALLKIDFPTAPLKTKLN